MYESRIAIRKPVESDIRSLAQLILRFYMFNEEFDPSMEVAGDANSAALKLSESRVRGEGLTLVADINGRVVGYVYGTITENLMLARRRIGLLKELYVVPEERGRGVASMLIEYAMRELSKQGIKYVAVEFPTLNIIAEKFYEKLGFRKFTSIYLKEV
ncbi:MAG: GNAT family N-acetyltransferase [Desulfurococcaceae archaeon]